jgi:predicted DNA-binding transcriptional regulator YafY
MTSTSSNRRRPAVHITLHRAARFHRLVNYLALSPRTRADILAHLKIGLRTFYRELDLLRRCGVKVRHKKKLYHLLTTAAEAEGRLPFPDPQLSFAEMAELARCDCPAGRRLAELLASVVRPPDANTEPRRPRARKAARSSRGSSPKSGKTKAGP